MQTSTYLYHFVEAQTDIQPNREILAPPGVDTEQDKEQVLSIGKHPSLMKVIHKWHFACGQQCCPELLGVCFSGVIWIRISDSRSCHSGHRFIGSFDLP